MDRFFIKGHRDRAVMACGFANAAEQLLSMQAHDLYGEDATLLGPECNAGSHDRHTEVWKATVCLPDSNKTGERYFVGELSETIIRIA